MKGRGPSDPMRDRESGGWGKRVDLGGGRILKKKKREWERGLSVDSSGVLSGSPPGRGERPPRGGVGRQEVGERAHQGVERGKAEGGPGPVGGDRLEPPLDGRNEGEGPFRPDE